MDPEQPSRQLRARRRVLVGLQALALAIACGGLAAGCNAEKKKNPPSKYAMLDYGSDAESYEFKDDVESNRASPVGYDELQFVDTSGAKRRLADFRDQQHVVLVFMRGFAGSLCPYCQTQTSRLIANYPEFTKRQAEVLLVYPGETEQLDQFLAAAREQSKSKLDQVPFPILLDEKLTAVEFFGIRDELAFPSTYILDKQGQVRFAYVGADITDRPSVKAMLEELDALQA